MSEFTTASGFLNVGDGHHLYWEDWGNPDGTPVMYLHGGPGASFQDDQKALFDPTAHRVLFFDQRGSGRSTPFASTENNTTAHLIGDIEKLLGHFGLDSVHVAGGSWGSALSLLYAIEYPERVRSLLIWSVYLVREFENRWVNEGFPRYQFPGEWERFISLVPEEHRVDGSSIMRFYAEKMRSDDEDEAARFAFEWTLWEMTLVSIQYDPAKLEAELREDRSMLSIALLETHYFTQGCFVPENHILDRIETLRHIPCQVVQGRFDMCTPAVSAYDLSRVYGDNLDLQWVNSGHLRTDPALFAALRQATARLG
ncbi:prolyl aminopeptidase [Streptomyces arenae]|uniref:prolyl aminopeptidase n=1 Tax=Streptomyces arenae TaxID=29301 RepID=UPI00265B355A|nr:prolyl aminopeptidase [Streptomyces arenae]MCG7207454.1 prolyl aminopeptidase [Streptomyces arenae]